MPVTTHPAPHGANVFTQGTRFVKTARELLPRSEDNLVKNNNIIQTTFKEFHENKIVTQNNGFVDGAVQAYNQHHHLVLRPEDVWFSILTQFNFYVNANSEQLRSLFVAHDGQKHLVISDLQDIRSKDPNAVFGVDWGKFSYKMTKMIADNIKDPSFREWILPTFTTTTKDDQAIASIIMMATLKKFFSYGCSIECGIPSVTLLGEKSDWEQVLARVERLSTFGKEPTQWLGLLRPVLQRFVANFDDPNSEEVKDFWQKIVHYSGGGSGPTYLSGWITAFCFWSDDGKPFYDLKRNNPPEHQDSMPTMGDNTPVLQLDGARYHRIETSDVPSGWASVPVELNDNGAITETVMVAGSLGFKVNETPIDYHL
jgi:hypothetical protein